MIRRHGHAETFQPARNRWKIDGLDVDAVLTQQGLRNPLDPFQAGDDDRDDMALCVDEIDPVMTQPGFQIGDVLEERLATRLIVDDVVDAGAGRGMIRIATPRIIS